MINHVPGMRDLQGQTVLQFGLDRTGHIEYHFNQQGFRSDLNFDHAPTCALFGCSLVFGVGVDNQQVSASLLPDTYNFGLAGNYSNFDIYQTIKNYLNSDLYSPTTHLCVVWTDRDQNDLINYVSDLESANLYHFFCGDLIAGKKNFKFIKNLDMDVSQTHMGPNTHAAFAKILWALFNR